MSAWLAAAPAAMMAYDLFVDRPKQRKAAERAAAEEKAFLRQQELRANRDRAYQSAAAPYTNRGPQQSFSSRPHTAAPIQESIVKPMMQYGFTALNTWQQIQQQQQQQQLNEAMMEYYKSGKQPPMAMKGMQSKPSPVKNPYLEMQ